jgi:conjugal transfer pilin signal peptidase TrbI
VLASPSNKALAWGAAHPRVRIGIQALLIIALAFPLAGWATSVVSQHYSIGLDLQKRTCLPWTAYLIHHHQPTRIHRGELAGFYPKGKMGSSFEGILVIKQIAGIPGDELWVKDDMFYVNGRRIGPLDLLAKLQKPSGYFDRRVVVPDGHYLFIGTLPRAYDGRYWGFVPYRDIVASAMALW